MQSLVFDVGTTDPLTFAVTGTLLGAVARLASDIPAFRPSLRRLPAVAQRVHLLRLLLQQDQEREGVRDQEQRHDQRRNEVGGSQLPWREAAVVGLVEGVQEID